MLNQKIFFSQSYLLSLIIFFFLFSSLTSQPIKSISLNDTIRNSISLDEGHEYYQLKIPLTEKNKILILITHEDKQEISKNDEIFSDPDIFISKRNKYPSSKLSSEWYSEKFGSDIISIPNILGNDTFYIGVYCQYKCRYFLHVYTSNEIEISLNKVYYFNIPGMQTVNYKLHIGNENFKKLKITVNSFENIGKYRIFMNKEGASSQNKFKIIPSWPYGYAIIINKNSSEYCINCDYHILIQNDDTFPIKKLIFNSYFIEDVTEIFQELPLYETMEKYSKRCYKFKISSKEKINEKIIIQFTLYSGKIDLLIEGWESKNVTSFLGLLFENFKNSKNVYTIYSQRHIMLNKTNFDFFDKENPKYINKDSFLHFCVYSNRETSFISSIYFLNKMQNLKEFHDANMLLPGNKIRGYLLKDQIFSYILEGINIDKANYKKITDIKISSENIVGNSKLYMCFCRYGKCTFNKNTFDKLLLDKKEIILSKNNEITIKNDENICYKNPFIKMNNGNLLNCVIVAIIHCEKTNDDGLCIYDIKLDIKDYPLLMTPKTIYKGIIPYRKQDYYEISITDKNIYSVVIVLNSENGDAELILSLKGSVKNLMSSFNDDYIPDVIRITPKKLGKENLIGNYIVSVYSTAFSVYKIYYYTTYIKNNEENLNNNITNIIPEITMNLGIGDVISDYFPNDIRYKIYSFSLIMDKIENVKIYMSKTIINFNIYVFTDISKFKILQFDDIKNNKKEELISGYDWKSGLNDDIIISNKDPKFKLNKNYYIVIAPQTPLNPRSSKINFHSVTKFYLGLISENKNLLIKEGELHTMILNNFYKGQKYYFLIDKENNEFELSINLLNGEIDIFIDLIPIDILNLNNLNNNSINYDSFYEMSTYNNTMLFAKNINSLKIIQLNNQYFSKYIPNNETKKIYIYYYIKRSNINNNNFVQYNLIVKTSSSTKEILQPGIARTSSVEKYKKQHYIIEEIQKRKIGSINLFFKEGYANLYVRIPEIPENKKIRFPSEANYDYIGQPISSGKIVNIPENIYEKLNNKNIKIQILITISSEFKCIFTITYTNEPKRINQNEPFEGFLFNGQTQYFTLFFSEQEKIENIYIGLSNMNGDADMFLNYGLTLPTPLKKDFVSNEMRHEFIDINLNNKFFKENNITTLSGFYTLLLVGFSDTSFSLYVSSHKNVILPLKNNRPVTCLCEQGDDKCLFRYTEVYNFNIFDPNYLKNNFNSFTEIVFTSQYFYGEGKMYAKVIKDSELHINNFIEKFPDQRNYDMNTDKSNQRDYMKMKISGKKYSKDSNILLTFICTEKTKVVITSTIKRNSKSFDHLIQNRENIYFLDGNENNKLTLNFYNYDKKKDLIYNIHSYIGEAHFEVYSNHSKWNITKQKLIYNYTKLNEFDINNNYDDIELNKNNNYFVDYHNYISVNNKKELNNIYFKVTPKSEFGFYIQIYYDNNWIQIPIDKMKSYLITNQKMYAYFDISNEYNSIEFSLRLEKHFKIKANLYLKINIIDTSKTINKNLNDSLKYEFSIPNENNYDYTATTDPMLGTLSLNIFNLPKLSEKEKKYKFIRGLLLISLNKNENTIVNILLNPAMKNFKFINANPRNYYFSNSTYEINDTKKIPETKIWALTSENSNHDIMVIELSLCYGDYEFKVQKDLITGESIDISLHYIEKKKDGKHLIYVTHLNKYKTKHFYLSIIAKESDIFCKIKKSQYKLYECGNNLAYILYYYTNFNQDISFTSNDRKLSYESYGKGKIKLYLPKIMIENLEIKKLGKWKFEIYATQNEKYSKYLGNVCYLSRFKENSENIILITDIKFENNDTIIINNLNYRSKYYIGVLVQNIENSELIALDPLVIWSGGYLPYSVKTILGIYLLIVIIAVLLIYFLTKLQEVKQELKEFKGETLPKSESDLRNMSNYMQNEDIMYSGIKDSY